MIHVKQDGLLKVYCDASLSHMLQQAVHLQAYWSCAEQGLPLLFT